ncbi:hypothetical protein [Prevotella sp. KH2C16]|uniref:hypothetical protein n=1 Tax=Prevotella sp. KH2C16 TaxID=1855325 RepID=UPI0008E3CBD7|nr:hypothetical protein [Prevotella sp. KH2C16]SFG12749.1 hypothetical protein SAMN05216383_105171 [Prevotella sp. KH2C16]
MDDYTFWALVAVFTFAGLMLDIMWMYWIYIFNQKTSQHTEAIRKILERLEEDRKNCKQPQRQDGNTLETKK